MLTAVNYGSTSSTSTAVYYFLHNSRGDITRVYNSSGTLRARYNYDSWGNVTVTDASGNVITDENHIGNLNKIRYRGYYQDTETGLYYLMSRYYDPQTHRFVNADGYFSTGQGILDTNMNIYCMNNPINYFDPTGTSCATHSYWYMPTCTACNPFYREYKEKKKSSSPPANYKPNDSTRDNCYSYAFGLPMRANPGDFSAGKGKSTMYSDKKIYTNSEITSYIMRDMNELNRKVRIVDFPSDKKQGEYIVAMKTSTKLVPGYDFADYHFAKQLSDGTWADKPGQTPSRWNQIDGTAVTWDMGNYEGYYDTESVYFAVEE